MHRSVQTIPNYVIVHLSIKVKIHLILTPRDGSSHPLNSEYAPISHPPASPKELGSSESHDCWLLPF